jgi:hypothetical protein
MSDSSIYRLADACYTINALLAVWGILFGAIDIVIWVMQYDRKITDTYVAYFAYHLVALCIGIMYVIEANLKLIAILEACRQINYCLYALRFSTTNTTLIPEFIIRSTCILISFCVCAVQYLHLWKSYSRPNIQNNSV